MGGEGGLNIFLVRGRKAHLVLYSPAALLKGQKLRADFREGDEDSNFSVFRVRRSLNGPKLFSKLPFL